MRKMLTRADEPLNFPRMHWRLIIDSPSEGVLDIGKPSRVISFFFWCVYCQDYFENCKEANCNTNYITLYNM